jgi:hypothetical protein
MGDFKDEAGEHLKRKSQHNKNRKDKVLFFFPEVSHYYCYLQNIKSMNLL